MVKKLHWPVLMAIGWLGLAALACSFSFSSARIDNARLATDEDGHNRTTIFSPTDTIYAVLELKNAPSGTTTKAIWTLVEADGQQVNEQLLESEELKTGSATIWFSLNNPAGLTAGKYKVDLYLDGDREKTLTFEVQTSE